ncbi:MAG: SPOR domain-containing protein [Gammaproteobacteria bacterium]|nr:SPOR domain-containing protein [Gammaproteobacteria bacterium]MCP5202056.1 SPOR domain-containing protein [Gammaproteobacteria bacterium]
MFKQLPFLAAVLATACAHRSPPAPEPAAVVPAPALTQPAVPTVASRGIALGDDCTVVRALDGRAVCAEDLPGGKARAVQPRLDHDAVPAVSAEPAPSPATHDYVVIGSFTTLTNAERWAAYNASFGPEIQRVEGATGPLYRVLVGPLGAESAPFMKEILGAVGIDGSWPLVTTCAACSSPPGTLPERKLAEVGPAR